MNKGFTLIELLAVIVILAIILAIAVPRITSLIDNSKKNSFESSTKMLLRAVQIKLLENSSFDITTINKDNLETLFNIDGDNYSKVSIKYDFNNKPYISIEGENQWSGYSAYGNFNNLKVESTIVTDGLVLYLDAANAFSYPGSGTTWYDLSGKGNNGTLLNGITYSSNNNGMFQLDNVDDSVQISSTLNLDALAASYQFTIMFGAQKLYYGNYGNSSGDSMFLLGSINGYNNGWRLTEVSMGTPGTAFTSKASWGFGVPPTSFGVTIVDSIANRPSICAFSKSSTNIYSFLNGYESNKTVPTTYVAGTSHGNLGASNFGVGKFAGNLYFILIYNRTLSPTEIKQNYEAFRTRFGY